MEDVAYLIEAVKMLYIDWSRADYDDADFFRSYVDYATDANFACGGDRVARQHAQAGDSVYTYQMTFVPSRSVFSTTLPAGWLGAGHGEDLFFVFGAPFIPEIQLIYPDIPPEEKTLSVKFMEFWTNFANTG